MAEPTSMGMTQVRLLTSPQDSSIEDKNKMNYGCS
jgi:hypothetical protein